MPTLSSLLTTRDVVHHAMRHPQASYMTMRQVYTMDFYSDHCYVALVKTPGHIKAMTPEEFEDQYRGLKWRVIKQS